MLYFVLFEELEPSPLVFVLFGLLSFLSNFHHGFQLNNYKFSASSGPAFLTLTLYLVPISLPLRLACLLLSLDLAHKRTGDLAAESL